MTTNSRLSWATWLDQGLRPEVQRYRQTLLNRIFPPFLLLGFVALGIGAWRAIQDGQWPFAAAYLSCYVLGAVAALALKRLSVDARAQLLLFGMLAIGVVGLVRLGLGGVGSLVLVAWCGLTGLLRGFRASLIAVVVSLVAIVASGVAIIGGVISLPSDPVSTSMVPGAWAANAVTFAAITAGLIIPLHALSSRLMQLVAELEGSNERLREEVDRRQRAEAALRANERRLRGMLESAAVGILELDLSEVRVLLGELAADGVGDLRAHLEEHPEIVRRAASLVRACDVNPAATRFLKAESKQELIDNTGQILAAGSLDNLRDMMVELAEGSSMFKGEVVGPTLQADEVHLLVQVTFIDEPQGRALATALDITERRRLQRSLAEAQKMEAIGTLAGGVAHDFNNILMSIGGYTALMLRRLQQPGPHREYLDAIHKMVDSGASLTRQLLGFARGGKYEVMTTDVQEQLSGSLSLFGRAKQEIETHPRFATDLWTIDVDRVQLEQVMLNLYVNAWHAMPDGGELHVSAVNVTLDESAAGPHGLAAGDYVRIAVRDTGTGMDPETRARVFEPFFTTRSLGRGTGLGLASAYGIVKNHGGTIEVDSEVGQGATFIIHLPASKKRLLSERPEAPPTETGSETLLLVDDQPAVLETTALMLEDLGYRVHRASSGEQALELFREHRSQIGLAMVDLVMPHMSGTELFGRLRDISERVPILVSSGYSKDDRADELLGRGRSGFMQKPFGIDDLAKKLRDLLDASA